MSATARTLALLPSGLVVAGEVPSLFGGPPRLKLEALPTIARVGSGGWTLSSEPARADEIAVDIVRLVTAPQVDGNARTASAVARKSIPKIPRELAVPALPSADSLLDAVAAAITARAPAGTRFVRPRALVETDLGKALCARLAAAGLVEADVGAVIVPTHTWLHVDALDVRKLDDDMTRLSGAGQAATLAAGLAPHICAFMLEIAPSDVWKSGYDALARRIAVLQVERRLRQGFAERMNPCRIGGVSSEVFPPLSSTQVTLSPTLQAELTRVRAAGEKHEKLETLVAQFARRAGDLAAALKTLRSVEVEVRLPQLAPAADWWTKQDGLAALSGDVVVAGAHDELFAHLAARHVRVVPAAAAWFHSSSTSPAQSPVQDLAPRAAANAPAPVPEVSAPPPVVLAPPPSTAVLDDGAPPPPPPRPAPPAAATAPPKTAPTTTAPTVARVARAYDAPFTDPQVLVVGPFVAGSLNVVVDGRAIEGAESRLDVTARRGDDRVVRVVGENIAHGAVVCVERDVPESSS